MSGANQLLQSAERIIVAWCLFWGPTMWIELLQDLMLGVPFLRYVEDPDRIVRDNAQERDP